MSATATSQQVSGTEPESTAAVNTVLASQERSEAEGSNDASASPQGSETVPASTATVERVNQPPPPASSALPVSAPKRPPYKIIVQPPRARPPSSRQSSPPGSVSVSIQRSPRGSGSGLASSPQGSVASRTRGAQVASTSSDRQPRPTVAAPGSSASRPGSGRRVTSPVWNKAYSPPRRRAPKRCNAKAPTATRTTRKVNKRAPKQRKRASDRAAGSAETARASYGDHRIRRVTTIEIDGKTWPVFEWIHTIGEWKHYNGSQAFFAPTKFHLVDSRDVGNGYTEVAEIMEDLQKRVAHNGSRYFQCPFCFIIFGAMGRPDVVYRHIHGAKGKKGMNFPCPKWRERDRRRDYLLGQFPISLKLRFWYKDAQMNFCNPGSRTWPKSAASWFIWLRPEDVEEANV
ncbi:uncharacterized protein LOC129590300 [Paramacrobiotus metropolitanus]|uniref:uncharacterized protein LOC129590300 n=1 Tax=Paramacrobiotus metropolitanus TaxID=2943436 RepID=UPI0024458081|nr:uncharacterized protein LOC129590300 [Paramacrobiotus metropolitanus]